jgi:hypothetical protein
MIVPLVMRKTWCNTISIIISLAMVILQVLLYLIGLLAGVSGNSQSLSWIIYSGMLSGSKQHFYLGLQGYYSSPSTHLYVDENQSYSDYCHDAGSNALFCAGSAVGVSIYFMFLTVQRLRWLEDAPNRPFICLVIALMMTVLGVAAYSLFDDRCGDKFHEYLQDAGYTDVRMSIGSGGACVLAAISCGVVIIIANFVEVIGRCCKLY